MPHRCFPPFLVTLLIFPFLAAAAQQATEPVDLAKQLADLVALVQKQQQQIDSLQRSQAELLQELRAARTGPVNATSVPSAELPHGSTATTGSGPNPPQAAQQPETSAASTSSYSDQPGGKQGISLGDRVRLGGYASMRFETNDVARGNHVPGGSAAGFTFRRLVLTTDARPASRLRIYSELQFERLFEIESEKGFEITPGSFGLKQTLEGNNGGEIALEQAWGQYNFAENHGFRAGIVLVPVGRFNLLHDDDYWDIPRRTLTDRDAPVLPIKSAWRDLGAGFSGGFSLGRTGKLDYQLYALSGAALDFNLEHGLTTTSGTPGSAGLTLNGEMQLTDGFFDGGKSACFCLADGVQPIAAR